MTRGSAMSQEEAVAAIDAGIEVANLLVVGGSDLIGVGEMGIGNTTAASAMTAALTGRPVGDVTGAGTGLDSAGRARKVAAIERALSINQVDTSDPVGVLGKLGGLEIAALVGAIAGAAAKGVPIVLDGFITSAAALVASRLQPLLSQRLIASHLSAEPGHAIALAELGIRPLFDLQLRLGEGSGAALAFDLIDAAWRIRDEMATFESARLSRARILNRESAKFEVNQTSREPSID
jgi:nicotinate-nucleotide--dimethylbenzimidazole phosphoribosyltransferase